MLFDTFGVISIILLTTFIQKYYFLVLYRIKDIHPILSFIFGFIIRSGVIIHELCHAFFGFLSGNKIREIHLFEASGGRVIFETKNYIGDISKYGMSIGYLFALILNQIGLFLISFWPLIFWITLSYGIFAYWGITGVEDLSRMPISYQAVFAITFYSILIPSFALSFIDIKMFFISQQENIWATIIGSIVNFTIFFGWMLSISYLVVDYFIFFWALFFGMFCIQIVLLYIFLLMNKFLKYTHS